MWAPAMLSGNGRGFCLARIFVVRRRQRRSFLPLRPRWFPRLAPVLGKAAGTERMRREEAMKKLRVRRTGPVRLSSAAIGCYTTPSCPDCSDNQI